jgi:hypothetical protein
MNQKMCPRTPCEYLQQKYSTLEVDIIADTIVYQKHLHMLSTLTTYLDCHLITNSLTGNAKSIIATYTCILVMGL